MEQKDLGVSGGLSGVARKGGGVVALTVCTTILTNVQASSMKELVPSAAIAAGLPPASVAALLSALPVGETALSQVPDITQHVIAAALTALQQYYIVALRYVGRRCDLCVQASANLFHVQDDCSGLFILWNCQHSGLPVVQRYRRSNDG